MLYPVLKIICNQRNHILLLQISGAVYEHHIHSANYTAYPKKLDFRDNRDTEFILTVYLDSWFPACIYVK